jgi:selenide,water dikinase
VLSKALGTGLALASGDEATITTAVASMRGLNRDAARALRAQAAVHAVTDLTGFGLLGHGWEMAERSQCHLASDASRLPALAGVLPVAGFVPVGQVTAGPPGVSLR